MWTVLWHTGSNKSVKLEGTLLSQVGQTCENLLDYYTALRKAGLDQFVPNQYKQRRSIPRNKHREMKPRYAQSQVKDWQQYTQISNSFCY